MSVTLSVYVFSLVRLVDSSGRNMRNSVGLTLSFSYPPTKTLTDGRRPCYIYHLPIMILGSLGTALSRTVPHLMAWRFVQAMGASPGISVGAGVIGDIYKLEERGTPYGSYFGVSHSVALLSLNI